MKKVNYKTTSIESMAKLPCRGVFWIVEDKLLAYPFVDDSIGVSKSGLTYNHKKLWQEIKPAGSSKPYNYYPRGRVDFLGNDKPVVWMNPNIDDSEWIPQIKIEFGLREEPKINWDFSEHYKCHLDDGWKADKRR